MFSQLQTIFVAPDSGKVFAEAWDNTNNEKMRQAKKRASGIRDIELDDEESARCDLQDHGEAD